MTKNEKLLISCSVLFALASGMSAVFMNVFLYTYTGSLTVMALYTCIRIGIFPFCFTLAGKAARKIGYGVTMSMGLIFMFFQLFYVIQFNQLFALNTDLVFVAAILSGFGESFYYLSVNTLNQLVTTPESRADFLSISGILSNISNVAAPLIATFIINLSGSDTNGYLNIFRIVLVVYGFISVLGLNIKAKGNMTKFSVFKSLTFQKDKQWRYVLLTHFIYGFRDSLILSLTGILVYNATDGSGSFYGRLLSLFSLLTILSYALASRLIKKHNRIKYYTYGAFFVASTAIVLVLIPNIYGALYYGVVNAVASPFYNVPFTIITMNALSDYSKTENLAGRVIAKETYLSLSRCLGLLFVVLCERIFPENVYLYIAVLTLSISPIILVTYSNIYHKKRKQKNN
ncbi:MAG: MFS transporter [Bacillota bacterium]|jgi:MFS family permease|nr:MFS transporter [Bacillota bacterium]NLL26154.1 MFS transporter [Erysipelotrichia bacterium]